MPRNRLAPGSWPATFRFGAWVALAAFLLDRVHKWVMFDLVGIDMRPPIAVTSFFDLTLVWNRGISYGLFQQGALAGHAGLWRR